MAEDLTLEVRNRREALAPACRAAEAWLAPWHPSTQAAYFLPLALEEALINCIQYAFDDSAEHTIHVKLSVVDQLLTITIIDDGCPFDPLAVPPPDLSHGIVERPVGGLGIFFMRSFADRLEYQRLGNTNHLTLTKNLANKK